jgi:hypothetical protein
MFGPFLTALNQALNRAIAELPHHAADETLQHFTENAEKINRAVNRFLLAIVDQKDAIALAMCTPEIQTALQKQGVGTTFAAVRSCLVSMTAFEHSPPQSNLMKTSCELTGTIQHQGGRSSSYHIDLARTGDDLWQEWRINGFNFERSPVSTPLIEAMNAALQKNAVLRKKVAARKKAVPPKKTAARKKPVAGKKAVAAKKAAPRKRKAGS